MKSAIAASPVIMAAFAAALTLAAAAVARGALPPDTLTLWAGAISAVGGEVPIGRIVASYPTVPFAATALLELIVPAGTPTPAVLAAMLLALMAGIWFCALRNAAIAAPVACVATFFIALHPAMLAACLAGPSEMLLAAFLYLLARGLYDLRARAAAPEVMTVGLALLGLAFSHPMGAALAFASVPALALAVPPSLVATSASSMIMALTFPTLFALGAFAYVSWVFPGDGWSFLAAPVESLAAWAAHAPPILRGITGALWLDAAIAALTALLLGAPIAAIATFRVWRRRPLLAAPAVIGFAVVGAAALSAATSLFGSPSPLAVSAPVLAAVVMTRVDAIRRQMPIAMALLAAGWIGGALALVILEPRFRLQIGLQSHEARAVAERLDALALGGASTRHSGVMLDTGNAPAVVVGRGQAGGLIGTDNPEFGLAIRFGRVEAPFVAVPDPKSRTGPGDLLNRTFPQLYRDGAPGYRLAYENATWRLYVREPLHGE